MATEVLDIGQLWETTGGDREFIRELGDVFLNDVEDRLRQIEAAIAQASWDETKAMAHSIKGASANVGAATLARLAEQLEELPSPDPTHVSALHAGLSAALADVRAAFHDLPEGDATPPTPSE